MIPTWTLVVVLLTGQADDGKLQFDTQFVPGYPSLAACERAGKDMLKAIGPVPNPPTLACVEEYQVLAPPKEEEA